MSGFHPRRRGAQLMPLGTPTLRCDIDDLAEPPALQPVGGRNVATVDTRK